MRKKSCKPSMLWILCLTAAVLLAGCRGQENPRQDKTLRIGFLGSQQTISQETPEILLGLDLAMEDLNRKYGQRGYDISYEFFDDKGESGGAAAQARAILGRKDIDFIFVLSQDPQLQKAAKRLAGGQRLTLWLDEAGQAARRENARNQFYNTYPIEAQAEAIVSCLVQREVRKAAVLYQPEGFTGAEFAALKAAAQEAGLELTGQALNPETQPEAFAQSLQGGAQAALILTGESQQNLRFIQAVREAAPQLTVVSDHTVDRLSLLREDAAALENVLIPCNLKTQWDANELDGVIRRYQAVYQDDTQVGRVSHGYFSAAAVVDAAVHCGAAAPELLGQYLRSPSSPRYQFDSEGMLQTDTVPMLQARDGVFQILDES